MCLNETLEGWWAAHANGGPLDSHLCCMCLCQRQCSLRSLMSLSPLIHHARESSFISRCTVAAQRKVSEKQLPVTHA